MPFPRSTENQGRREHQRTRFLRCLVSATHTSASARPSRVCSPGEKVGLVWERVYSKVEEERKCSEQDGVVHWRSSSSKLWRSNNRPRYKKQENVPAELSGCLHRDVDFFLFRRCYPCSTPSCPQLTIPIFSYLLPRNTQESYFYPGEQHARRGMYIGDGDPCWMHPRTSPTASQEKVHQRQYHTYDTAYPAAA